MINILPTSKQVLATMNEIFTIVILYFSTKALSTLFTIDSVLAKKVFKNSKDTALNRFFCVVAKVVLWIAAFLIAMEILGFDITIFSESCTTRDPSLLVNKI